jgi:hypothetical protein
MNSTRNDPSSRKDEGSDGQSEPIATLTDTDKTDQRLVRQFHACADGSFEYRRFDG